MNIRCPICNAEMTKDKVILTNDSGKDEPTVICENDKCIKVGLVLPATFRSPAANAMANCVIALATQLDEQSKKLWTKKREGRAQGITFAAKILEAAMAAVGYTVQVKRD